MTILRSLACAVLGHRAPATPGPACWWNGAAFFPGACRRCGLRVLWPTR